MTLTSLHNKIQNNFPFFAKNCLKIATKSGEVVPFVFNRAQLYAHKLIEEQKKTLGMVRALLLKGRQQGMSTYIGGRYFHQSITKPNKNTFILSHDSQTTDKLFSMVDKYYKYLPEPLQPGCATKNQRKMVFEGLESTYSVGTAGNAEVGRGGTLQYFHGSEVAFWQNTDNLDTGLLQSVADLPGTEIALETTANGASGYYFEKCMMAIEGKGEYQLIFIPWFWQDEYRKILPLDFRLTEEEIELQRIYPLDDQQIYWRRKKIEDFRGKEWKFKQEYPMTAMEAFQTSGEKYFRAQAVVTAMNNPRPDETGAPLIIGVDPAGGGKDEVSISWRRGRDFYKYLEIPGIDKDRKDPMHVVGMLVRIFEEDNPDMMFIDMGYGGGIVSRLRELGYGKRVIGVYFAESAMDTATYSNKRAEMHDLYREWLEEDGVSIPNEMKVQKQMACIPQERLTSSGKQLLPPKEEIKKANNGESPNIIDSAVLTFAFPVRAKGAKGAQVRKANTPQDLRKQQARSPLLTMRPKKRQDNSMPIMQSIIGGN